MIRELNSANFHETVSGAEFAVIDGYGDFCYACELLQPVLEALSVKMPCVPFYKINLTQNFDIADELQIFDFPTVLFVRNGEIVAQAGGSMEAEEVKQYISGMLYGE